MRGPDPIVIRIPRNGGTARAYLYPRLDSAVWSGSAPSADSALGFDPEGGTLVLVNARGLPARLDLRLGAATLAGRAHLSHVALGAGSDVYGIDPKGAVVRLTRAGTWRFVPPAPALGVFPQSDGTLVVAGQRRGATDFWRLYPPDTRLRDTLRIAARMGNSTIREQVGDRVYFATDSALVGLRARDMSEVAPIRIGGTIAALAATPSGDRLYVAVAGARELDVVDRYTDRVERTIAIPGPARELRVDPLGRFVIVRPARGDSAWVIAVATDRLVGSTATRWTGDLPATAQDGAIALARGKDVVFVDGETLQRVRVVRGGAADFWYFTFWNGFRPRARGVDEPVSFGTESTAARPADSTAPAPPDSAAPATDTTTPHRTAASPAPVPPAQIAPAPGATPAPQTYTVSFAALLDGARARALADSIAVDGARARVVVVQRAGTPVYRVVLGPYGTRAAAEQAGRASRRSYWIFAGEP